MRFSWTEWEHVRVFTESEEMRGIAMQSPSPSPSKATPKIGETRGDFLFTDRLRTFPSARPGISFLLYSTGLGELRPARDSLDRMYGRKNSATIGCELFRYIETPRSK